MSDPVRDLLDRLERDVARVPDPDVASVRRRGAQRRRRQGALAVAGSALTVVAIAAVTTSLTGSPHAHQPPAASSAPSLPSPTASPAEELTFTFLTPSALPDPATGGRWRVVDAQPDSAVARCVDPASTGATASEERWFATGSNPKPGDEIAVELVLTFDTDNQASAAVASLVAKAKACSSNSDPVLSPTAGDDAKTLYFRYDDGLVDAASMQSLVVVQVGARVAVLTVAMDGNGDIPYIDDLQQQLPVQLAQALAAG